MKYVFAVAFMLIGFAAVLPSEDAIIPYSRLPIEVTQAHRGCRKGYEYDGTHDKCILRDARYEITSPDVIHVCSDESAVLLTQENGKNICVRF